MTELMKRFEVEMNWSLEQAKKDHKVGIFLHAYIEWLEAQLTWRPVSERPERDGDFICAFGNGDFNGLDEIRRYRNGIWYWWDYEMEDWVIVPDTHFHTDYLPIPRQGE